ncbi:MAG TPA: LemA family protein, partial [Acidimicrobiales bacterium]
MTTAQSVGVGVLIGWLLILTGMVSYNRFVRQRNLVAESWRQIDVELVRRHDLVPGLVATVQGYATHERALFEMVETGAHPKDIAQAHGFEAMSADALGAALDGVIAAHPDEWARFREGDDKARGKLMGFFVGQ